LRIQLFDSAFYASPRVNPSPASYKKDRKTPVTDLPVSHSRYVLLHEWQVAGFVTMRYFIVKGRSVPAERYVRAMLACRFLPTR